MTSPPVAAANSLCVPDGIAADTNGNLWIDDQMNNRVLRFTPPFPTGSPGPSANLVLGQLNFTDTAPNSVDSTSYHSAGGIAIDRSVSPNRLYVADTNNNRVLGYKNAVSFTSGAPADLVIGQTDFAGAASNQGGSVGANTLSSPRGVAVNWTTGDLFVADNGNNRVLRYPAPFKSGKTANQSANLVFGQGGDFTASNCPSPPTASSLCNPVGVALDTGGNLYVTDQTNNRAELFKAPFPASPAASKIFGQSGPTGQFCNRSAGPPSASTLCAPAQLAVDGSGHLFIADLSNNRVLEFNTPITSQVANKVYGQHNSPTSANCDDLGLDANALCGPVGVTVDGAGRLYIGDSGDNRVLGFKTPLTSTTADMVFGQGDDFLANACNSGGSSPSPQTLCNPTMVATDAAGDLFAADTNNNRALQYLQPYAKPGVLSLSATSLSFGTVPVGTKSTKSVTLTNTGIVPIFIYKFTVSGTNAADFTQTNNCVGNLQPTKSCMENVTFKPSVKKAESAAITISDNASNAPQHISPITGTGS